MAEDVVEGVNPTRMELLATRKKRKLAQKGHKLLGEKRDALVVQFIEVLKKRGSLRTELEEKLSSSYGDLIKAEMMSGSRAINTAARSYPDVGGVPASSVSVMGVKVPRLETDLVEIPRGIKYGSGYTTASLDQATTGFQDCLELVIKLAEVEGTIVRLASEIEKTKRRVNALEHIFIPRLLATEKYIGMQLQEREREDFFRRKRIKSIMEAQEKEAAS